MYEYHVTILIIKFHVRYQFFMINNVKFTDARLIVVTQESVSGDAGGGERSPGAEYEVTPDTET